MINPTVLLAVIILFYVTFAGKQEKTTIRLLKQVLVLMEYTRIQSRILKIITIDNQLRLPAKTKRHLFFQHEFSS